jgi:WD40 repeat protein
MIDFVNEENTSEIKTIHEEVRLLKMCPNGRYIITGGDKGDICIWQIKKHIEIPTLEGAGAN